MKETRECYYHMHIKGVDGSVPDGRVPSSYSTLRCPAGTRVPTCSATTKPQKNTKFFYPHPEPTPLPFSPVGKALRRELASTLPPPLSLNYSHSKRFGLLGGALDAVNELQQSKPILKCVHPQSQYLTYGLFGPNR